MAKTSPDLITGTATGELAHGSRRLWDAIAISVSVLAPGMAMLLNVSRVAAVSGSTPLSFLLGGVACLALAFVVIGFIRRRPQPATPAPMPAAAWARARFHGGLAVFIWRMAGVAVLLGLRARRPESVARIGSILGEEGGTDAAILDA